MADLYYNEGEKAKGYKIIKAVIKAALMIGVFFVLIKEYIFSTG